MRRKYTIKDIKSSSNYRSMRIKCNNANERIRLLQVLLAVGLKWHGETKWTAMDIEHEYPWSSFSVVEFDIGSLYIQGNRSSVYLQTITFQSFMEAINDD